MRPLSVKFLQLMASGLLLLSSHSHAENADCNQPINLEADTVVVDDAKHISTFTGNVKLTQGTLKITATQLVVVQGSDGFSVRTASGDLASFRQKREACNEIVEGFGITIIYYTRNENVDLQGNARVKRTADEVRGDHITYSTQTEIFQVHSKPIAEVGDPNKGRVQAVIQPKNKDANSRGKP